MHPNRLVADGIERGLISELQGYDTIRREVRVSARSRLDLCLTRRGQRCLVEVKNVTLGLDGVAAFPDAVTERGTKHLRELIRLARRGDRATLIFVVQRNDCHTFRPADEIDPEYGRWLRRAAASGVEILVYQGRVTSREIRLIRRLPVCL
jgi:sugar fermentation stimulation protein A